MYRVVNFNLYKYNENNMIVKERMKNINKLLKDVNFNNLDQEININNLGKKRSNEQYIMKCQYCKSFNVKMDIYYELQECLDCKKKYIANIEQLK